MVHRGGWMGKERAGCVFIMEQEGVTGYELEELSGGGGPELRGACAERLYKLHGAGCSGIEVVCSGCFA